MLKSVEVFIEGKRRPPKSFSSEGIVFKNEGGTLCLLQQQEASEFRVIRRILLAWGNEKTGTL